MKKIFWLLGVVLVGMVILWPAISYADMRLPPDRPVGRRPYRATPKKKAAPETYSIQITMCDEDGNCPEEETAVLLPEPSAKSAPKTTKTTKAAKTTTTTKTAKTVKVTKTAPVQKKNPAAKVVKTQPVRPVSQPVQGPVKWTSSVTILPTLDSPAVDGNQAWAGTFQLVWNDFSNELLRESATFIYGNPPMANLLNKQAFDEDELSASSYYKKWGATSPQLKKEIEQGIKEKFNETSEVLDAGEWTPGEGKYTLYAMLKKDFEYVAAFNKLQPASFAGSQEPVAYFGLGNDNSKKSVRVLFYNNPNDFAVTLLSKQGDQVHLYRTDNPGSLDALYRQMKAASQAYDGPKSLNGVDEFKAPVIEFNSKRSFEELCGQPIHFPDHDFPLEITLALETIQFKMDEKGVKLKSEAIMQTRDTSARPFARTAPRYFNVTGRYAIFAEEEGKSPYFAMLVADAAQLQK